MSRCDYCKKRLASIASIHFQVGQYLFATEAVKRLKRKQTVNMKETYGTACSVSCMAQLLNRKGFNR